MSLRVLWFVHARLALRGKSRAAGVFASLRSSQLANSADEKGLVYTEQLREGVLELSGEDSRDERGCGPAAAAAVAVGIRLNSVETLETEPNAIKGREWLPQKSIETFAVHVRTSPLYCFPSVAAPLRRTQRGSVTGTVAR